MIEGAGCYIRIVESKSLIDGMDKVRTVHSRKLRIMPRFTQDLLHCRCVRACDIQRRFSRVNRQCACAGENKDHENDYERAMCHSYLPPTGDRHI